MPLPPTPGTYVLILEARRRRRIQVGRLGELEVLPGHYLYVGSAFGPGGLKARVERHLRSAKRSHWHIDHLRRAAEIVEVWWSEEPQSCEHEWAGTLASLPGLTVPLRRFGASDCRCIAHLFFSDREPELATHSPAPGITTWKSFACTRPRSGSRSTTSTRPPSGGRASPSRLRS